MHISIYSSPSPSRRRLAVATLAALAPFASHLHGQTTPHTHEDEVTLDEYVVSASPFARTTDELHQAAGVLVGDRLDDVRASSLGETLAGQPGISSTAFGPGASRPVIRGLDGERIRVLTNGVGTIDASGTSPDHAVSLDPALIEKIEILRGPSALLYGSSAAGGVINVVENQIPIRRPDAPLDGTIHAHYGSAADERAGAASFRGNSDAFGWQASYSARKSGDLRIPGYAEVHDEDEHQHEEEHDEEHEDEEVYGKLLGSAVDTRAGSAGLAWFWGRGRVGVAVSGFDTRYGVPGHAHHHEDEHEHDEEEGEGHDHEAEHEEGDVVIDLEQRRIDFAFDLEEPLPFLRDLRMRLGIADYTHLELEGDEIGTRFDTKGWEGRIDALRQPVGAFEGAIGLQMQRHELSADGEEAFLPPTRTTNAALFGIEELVTGSVRWQAGARLERHEVDVLDGSAENNSKTALSASLGALWTPTTDWTLALSLARTERNPTAQEWYADGPHAATRAYEIGDPGLGKEKSTGIDLNLRRRTGAVTGSLSLFHTDYDRYIYAEETGEEEDGLDVYRFVARDARFHGGELEVVWHLHETPAHTYDITFFGDVVRATNRTDGTDLPRIPAARVGAAFDYHGERWALGFDVRHSFDQERTAPGESPSSGYTLVGAHVGWNLPLESSVLSLYLRAHNLFDEEARPHTSYLKDLAPLSGRNIVLGARLAF
ncbi:TonB-dependent receptor [Opitutales bacterium ASA1]|uniref:TonB-dependent receptor n=1 Tax=Congregicoccus parvus TaxID=3081749 RepID=UPI002B298848|nr:TonB-dependent receptor [Opitutales bacterium ASA1]